MLVQFNGHPVYGTVLDISPEAPMLQAKVTKFFGVIGESELRGQRGGRMIHIHMLIYKSYRTRSDIKAAMNVLDKLVGVHGELRIANTGNERQTHNDRYPFCTFLGFEKDQGHDAGPLYDEAGTLDGGWWVQGRLTFRQLVVPT